MKKDAGRVASRLDLVSNGYESRHIRLVHEDERSRLVALVNILDMLLSVALRVVYAPNPYASGDDVMLLK